MKLRYTATSLAILSVLLPVHPAFSIGLEASHRAATNVSDTIVADGTDLSVDNAVVATVDGPGLHALGGGTITVTDSQISTQADVAHAVMVEGGGRIDLVRSTVNTQGAGASVLYVHGAGSTVHARETSMVTAGTGTGIIAREGARIELENVTATARVAGGHGVFSLQDSALVATDTDLVAVDGLGLEILGNSQVSYIGGSISASDTAVGVGMVGSSTLSQAVISFRDTDVRGGRDGINIWGAGAQVTLDRVRITTTGTQHSSAGLRLNARDSTVTVIDSHIEAFGDFLDWGVANNDGALSMAGGSITTHGQYGFGMMLLPTGSNDAASIYASDVAIETRGELGVGAFALGGEMRLVGGSIATYGREAYGILTVDGARMGLQPGGLQSVTGTTLTTHGQDAHGFVAYAQAPQIDAVDLHTYGAGANGIWLYSQDAASHYSLAVGRGSRIETEDGAAIRVSGGSQEIRLSDTDVIGRSNGADGVMLSVQAMSGPTLVDTLFNPTQSGDTVAVGQVNLAAERSRLTGDVVVTSGSTHIALRDHSSLAGALRDSGEGMVDTLSIDDSSAWRVRADSTLKQLDTTGTVSFVTPDNSFKVVDVTDNLTGAGLFEMRTDLGTGQGDLLRVGGTVEGNHQVLVANSGREPAAGRGTQRIIQSEGGAGSFSLANRGQVVDVGTYRYELQREDAVGGRPSDWSLVMKESRVTESGGNDDLSPTANDLSTTANAAINTSAVSTAQAIWHAENGWLVRRMGDLREQSVGDNGWLRSFRERQNIDNRGARAFHQTVQGMQGGVDKRVAVSDGQWHVGGFAGLSHTARNFNGEGSGRSDSYHVGAYATYLDQRGWYLDGILKANRLSSRFDVTATDGRSVHAKTQTGAVGMSLEVGRRIPVAGSWFIEPQAQMAVVRVGGDTYRASNALQISAAAGNSVQVRAGSLIGKRVELQGGDFIQPYVKAGWVQELDGKSTVRTNGIGTHTDLSGGRIELGLGVTASLGKRHRLYADYQYSSGAHLDTPASFSLGYRYIW